MKEKKNLEKQDERKAREKKRKLGTRTKHSTSI